jgi:GR25 family glycosyltransferase involved in LPS biosynthesis
MPVDDFMNQEYLHGVQYLGVVPYPIGTRAVPSTIDERRKHHLNLLMKLRREVYRIPEGFARWLYKIRQ